MNEEELIGIISELIDAHVGVMDSEDIARRALDRCGEGIFEREAVIDLAAQILSARCEPWKWPPGARPRLKGWNDGISRLTPKPSVAEILYAGKQAGDPLEVTFARVGAAYPNLTGDEMQAEIDSYIAWVQRGIEQQLAERAKLNALLRITKPATDEDPSLTMSEALKVMASRGCDAAREVLSSSA
jgi:hypothetical protein